MIFFLSFLFLSGFAQTNPPSAAPTVPTPFPTITPAPESQCQYLDTDNGPFALDCLQLLFLQKGCSTHGLAYPTVTTAGVVVGAGNLAGATYKNAYKHKAVYNAGTWLDVNTLYDQIVADADPANCRGEPTSSPTLPPTPTPTTLPPTPSPTAIQNQLMQTPAPTTPMDSLFDEPFYINNGANTPGPTGDIKDDIFANCTVKYMRQYDMTDWVLKVESNGFVDYYTTELHADCVGCVTSNICEAIRDFADNTNIKIKYSPDPYGPFMHINGITGRGGPNEWKIFLDDQKSVVTTQTFDGRPFTSWLSSASNGGYGAQDPQAGIFSGVHNLPYTLSMGTYRKQQACVEQRAPQLPESFVPYGQYMANSSFATSLASNHNPVDHVTELGTGTNAQKAHNTNHNWFFTPCHRTGTQFGQVWTSAAQVCNGGDNTALLYAIANHQFSTCDSVCVYGVNYDLATHQTELDAGNPTADYEQFWSWQAPNAAVPAGCWKPATAYLPGEYRRCDPTVQTGNGLNFENSYTYDYRLERKETLCKARCLYEENWYFVAKPTHERPSHGPKATPSPVTDATTDRAVFYEGTCMKASTSADYGLRGASGLKREQGLNDCALSLSENKMFTFGQGQTVHYAAPSDKFENEAMEQVCRTTVAYPDPYICYFGEITGLGTRAGAWDLVTSTEQVTYVNWEVSETYQVAKKMNQTDYELSINAGSAMWSYIDPNLDIPVMCEVAADVDDDESRRTTALACMTDANFQNTAGQFPILDIVSSGFDDIANPGSLTLYVDVPKTLYEIRVSFEDATNDDAEYNWSYDNDKWEEVVNGAESDCTVDRRLKGSIPWTIFNLGGAGGVKRMVTWQDGYRAVHNTSEYVNKTTLDSFDTMGHEGEYYIFGSTVRIQTFQPIHAMNETDISSSVMINRDTSFVRETITRVPFIIYFQKTITVSTDVSIKSTKFNYKTVAAIIRAIQYDTQYFQPPYAKIMVHLRTKSQYPYMMNNDTATTILHKPAAGGVTALMDLTLDWLWDSPNCTYVPLQYNQQFPDEFNPDHMREGDICTQEWMLNIVPGANVCYATGEYGVEYLMKCFNGKDVCYLPKDTNGIEITTTKFVFKIQTSKFCPQVADEVDLSGTLEVTGRESFYPALEQVEGPSNGQFYMQGEYIHFLAKVSSTKATITAARVIMVELEQDLSTLVQTGYYRVPYDPTTEDITVWMRNPTASTINQVRVNDGTITIDDGTQATTATVMTDAGVYDSGSLTPGLTTFPPTECGFRMLLHSRVFPVNVDSFGSKTIVATVEVEYLGVKQANQIGGRRRRLVSSKNPTFSARSSTQFQTNPWKPQKLPAGLGTTATMSLEATLQSYVTRANVWSFVTAFETAVVDSLNNDYSAVDTVYDSQVAVESVYSNGKSIWQLASKSQLSSRRLQQATTTFQQGTAQRLKIVFTFANTALPGSMQLRDMIRIFNEQLISPSSPLMQQPLFFGAVVHEVKAAQTGGYLPPNPAGTTALASSSSAALPAFALLALLQALW